MELKVTSSSTSRTLDFLHFLSRQSLSYFCIMTIDSMVFLQHTLIHRIMVIKSHKSKASFLARLPISNDLNGIDFSIFLKVLSKMMLLGIFLNSTNKQLLHRYTSPWLPRFPSCSSTFQLTLPSTEGRLAAMAESTSALEEKVTKPNPLDFCLQDSSLPHNM